MSAVSVNTRNCTLRGDGMGDEQNARDELTSSVHCIRQLEWSVLLVYSFSFFSTKKGLFL